ncbi:hypothetical protein Vretifemale_8642 [Volvox reticuliferus]|uniref:Uncharacterized protein n=1 Tax=Volvox reticuliferus TaxID=1737510 RepID=A0A8J4CBM4_9CHLO|nr:hypothetical protein Vretifemale_8642 [Volvox reticuliferus]
MSRYAAAAGGGNATTTTTTATTTTTTTSISATGSSGNSSVVSSPYCLVAMRGGKYFAEEVLQCVGIGCRFVEGSQSYTCSGGMRCGCPNRDPAATAAGAPASLSYCGTRIQTSCRTPLRRCSLTKSRARALYSMSPGTPRWMT